MKVIILYNIDGSNQFITPAIKNKRKNETEEKWLNRTLLKINPDNLDYEIIDSLEYPDSTDYDCLVKEKGKPIIVCPIKKAEKEALKLQKEKEKLDKKNAFKGKIGLNEQEFQDFISLIKELL